MRNPEVDELLQFLDNHPGNATISKQKILDPPSRLFFTVKSMYQAFKKSNEYQLMQHKVYKVVIKQQSKNNYEVTKVNAKTLCQTHKFEQTDIVALIKIYVLLPFQKQIEMLHEILQCITKLSIFEEYCKCYKFLIQNTKKNQNFSKLYPIIEVKMFKTILDMQLQQKDFESISKLILSLPRIDEEVMFFIGDLFEKVDSLDQFKMIELIFQEKIMKNPTPYELQAVFKVGTPTNLNRIKKFIEKDSSYIPLLQQQAKNKLKKSYTILNEKSLAVIQFIGYCISLKCQIWKQILNWQSIICGDCKIVLLEKVTEFLNEILQNQKQRLSKSFLEIIVHMAKRDSESLITQFLFESIMKMKDKKFLSNKVIRRFLAIKILTIQNFSDWETLFNASLYHTETILELFNFEKDVVPFFKKIIENPQNTQNPSTFEMLKKYLNELLEKQPINFKDFFVKVDQTVKGQIFNTTGLQFLFYFWKIPFTVAYSIVRQLANKPPSRFLIVSLAKFLQNLQKPKELMIMKTQIIKTINTILISPYDLSQEFRAQLVGLCGKFLTPQDQQILFKDVSIQLLKTIKSVDAMMKRR